MLFCEVRPITVGSTGLGNRLLPWARCLIYARLHSLPMLATRWAQLPVGSFRRRDAEPRLYANLFSRPATDIGGWRRLYIRAFAKKLSEPDSLVDAMPMPEGLNLVVFAGLGNQFRQLQGWNETIGKELRAMTRRSWREKAEAISKPFVGIHVRRGDFQRVATGANVPHKHNVITPLGWFIAALKLVRAQALRNIPAVVTSDGTRDELAALLELDNVQLVSTGSAIGDLLLLSRSSVLLASGSTFSAWASYLGQVPTLSYPGQSLGRLFQLESVPGQLIGELDPNGYVSERLACTLRELMSADRAKNI